MDTTCESKKSSKMTARLGGHVPEGLGLGGDRHDDRVEEEVTFGPCCVFPFWPPKWRILHVSPFFPPKFPPPLTARAPPLPTPQPRPPQRGGGPQPNVVSTYPPPCTPVDLYPPPRHPPPPNLPTYPFRHLTDAGLPAAPSRFCPYSPPGSYMNGSGHPVECNLCGQGRYQPATGQAFCFPW